MTDPIPTRDGWANLLDNYIPYKLYITAATVAQLFAKVYFKEFGLALPEWRVVAVLGGRGELTQQATADLVLLDKMTVSRAAASLMSRGLLKKRPDLADRRSLLLSLTDEGTRLYKRLAPFALGMEQKLLEGLAAGDIEGLERALAKVQGSASRLAREIPDGHAGQRRHDREASPIPPIRHRID